MKMKAGHAIFLLSACFFVGSATIAQTFTDSHYRLLSPAQLMKKAIQGQLFSQLKNPYSTPTDFEATDPTLLQKNIRLECKDSCQFTLKTNSGEIRVPAYVDRYLDSRSTQIDQHFYDQEHRLIGYESLTQSKKRKNERKFIVFHLSDNKTISPENGLIQVVWLDLPSSNLQYAGYDQNAGLLKFVSEDNNSAKKMTYFYTIDGPNLLIKD